MKRMDEYNKLAFFWASGKIHCLFNWCVLSFDQGGEK